MRDRIGGGMFCNQRRQQRRSGGGSEQRFKRRRLQNLMVVKIDEEAVMSQEVGAEDGVGNGGQNKGKGELAAA